MARTRCGKRRIFRAAGLIVVTLVVGGCTDVESGRPTIGPERHVEVAGVVQSYQLGVDGSRGYTTYTFDDGRTYRVYNNSGPEPAVGDLLIAGGEPFPWVNYAKLEDPRSWPAGCYGYPQNGYELETTIQLDSGLILEKAPGFSRRPVPVPRKDNRLWGLVLCLDKQGRVFEIVG